MKIKFSMKSMKLSFFVFNLVILNLFCSQAFIQLASDLKIKKNLGRKIRRTQDGRKCLTAFVKDGITYYDCTKAKSPDGLFSNREWCYVEQSNSGVKNWDYCREILDYDKIRESNQDYHKTLNLEVQQLNIKLIENMKPAQNTVNQLKNIKDSQDNLYKNLITVYKDIDDIAKILSKIYKKKNTFDKQDKLTKDLTFQIEQKIQYIKDEDNKNPNPINIEELSNLEQSHSSIMISNKSSVKNCKNMMLYEDEESGDGIIGRYYDNENWLGPFLERKDDEINFDWTGSSPIKGINSINFSVIWEGYLLVPYTGNYRFSVESEGGFELEVNEKLLIKHKMGTLLDIDGENDIGEVSLKNKNYISSNKSIFINSDSKVKIKLSYFHSIHNDIEDLGQIYVKLFAFSDEIRPIIIPKRYLYSFNYYPQLKITNFPISDAILRKLNENDFAFKNSDRYIVQDIPQLLRGSPMLRYNYNIKTDINFYLNSPSVVFIAYLSHYPNPLPSEFENTNIRISLVYIDNQNKIGNKRLTANQSSSLMVYKKSYPPGNVRISLSKSGINKHGIPLIVFFGFDNQANIPIRCSGEMLHLSSLSPYYIDCTASSEKDGFNCESGFNGKMRDEEGGMWASNNEGEGAWIEVRFKGLFEITKFTYKDKKNSSEHNSELQLKFSNGIVKKIKLLNSDDIQSFIIEGVRASGVLITIISVYGTINNGGSFNFYGYICGEESNNNELLLPNLSEFYHLKKSLGDRKIILEPIFNKIKNNPINLNCFESLSNTNKFDKFKLKKDIKIPIRCNESCINLDYPIYGGPNYSKDSVLCKAAYHSGVMDINGGTVYIIIKDIQSKFSSITFNGVTSLSRIGPILSITFDKYIIEDPIILKKGSKIDYLNKETDIWKKGLILEVINSNNVTFLNIADEDQQTEIFRIEYPNSRIKPCGYYTKNRICKGSVKFYYPNHPVKIRFVPKGHPNSGDYLPDSGEEYGYSNQPYGWSRDMTSKIVYNTPASSPELETFIQFPPPQTSNFCNRSNPLTNCEPVVWSIWSGKGKFVVKILIGDMNNNSINNININGKIICKNYEIKSGELKIFEEIIESKHGFLNMTSECSEDCDYSSTIINGIEIYPYNEEKKNSSREIKLDCGESFSGGRCDDGMDVINCIYDNKYFANTKYCSGELILMKIADDYKCKNQIGKYKCVKILYENEKECSSYCPRKCLGNKCIY